MMRYENNHSFEKVKKPEQHPVWRGIGFLIMLIIPFVAFSLSEMVLKYLKENVRGFVVPLPLRTSPIQIANDWMVVDLWAVILIALFLIFILLSLIVLVNTIVYALTKNRKKNIFEADKKDFKK